MTTVFVFNKLMIPTSTNTANELNEEALDEVYKWSKIKNLIFNPDKTRFMIFTTYKSKIRNTLFSVLQGEIHGDLLKKGRFTRLLSQIIATELPPLSSI